MKMKLNFEQIRDVILGAAKVVETENGICMHRFTEEQEELYRQTDAGFYKKTSAAAGIKLCFETDSHSLWMKVSVAKGSSREYFSIDVMADGNMVGCIDNYSGLNLPQDYTKIKLADGEFSKSFALGEGSKSVCIYMPWSVSVNIKELALDDNAFIKPIKPGKKILVFGDSITQGYDALRPSNRYTARLAEFLDAEEINKAIGGEMFFPELAKTRDDFDPDYITVAYGTNDWGKTNESDFKERCYAFYDALYRNYPKAKIFAITPVWRKDYMKETEFGDFSKVKEDIENIVKNFPNMICIDGYDLIPQDIQCFADLRLHPNDSGFEHYFQNLSRKIRERL